MNCIRFRALPILPPVSVVALFLGMALFRMSAYSQSPSITWSMANTKPAMKVDLDIYGEATGYFVVNQKPAEVGQFSPGITIEYFDEKQERKFANNYPVKDIEDFCGIHYVGKTLYVFKALFSKESGANTLTATPVNTDGSTGKPVNLAKISAEKLAARGLFSAAVSPDGNNLVVISMPNFEKDANERITVTLFNGKLEKTWSKEFTYSYPWTRAVYNEPFVNNAGMVFILKKTDMKGEGLTYSLFSCGAQGLQEFKLPLDGNRKAKAITCAIAPDGGIAVGGYFTEQAKVSVSMGIPYMGAYLLRVDASGKQATVSTVRPFEKRKNLVAKSILFHNDMTILTGETNYMMDRATDDAKRKAADPFARDYDYYGNDIYIDGFDGAGKAVYATHIEKDNNSRNDNGTWVSFFADMHKGKILVIFNDDKYKYDEKKKVVVFGGTRILVYATVDPATGALTPAAPIENTGFVGGKQGDMLLRPDEFLRLPDGRYVLRAENPTIYRMGIAVMP